MTTDLANSCQVFASMAQVDAAAWDALARPGDLAMDRRTLAAQETHLRDQMQFAYFLVRGPSGAAAACAVVGLYVVDAAASAPAFVRRAAGFLRKLWPGLLRFRLASCGLPIPSGANHLRAAADAAGLSAIVHLEREIRTWARRRHASLIVFKEFDDTELAGLQPLADAGYLRGPIPPMHHLTARFRSFEEYAAALKSRYRNQVRRSQKKGQACGLHAVHVRDPVEIARLFTDEVHALYTAVWQRSAYRQEHFPPQFYRDLAAAFPGQASLTLLYRDNQPVAFAFGLAGPHGYHSLYSGIAYDLNDQADLYFNLFYEDLDHAFQRALPDIQLGQTADSFKSRLGSTQRALYAFVRATHPLANFFFHACGRWLFPPLPAVESHDVFHSSTPRNGPHARTAQKSPERGTPATSPPPKDRQGSSAAIGVDHWAR